ALFTHIWILWRLGHYQVPQVPPSDVLQDFFVHFSSEHDLVAVDAAGLLLVDASIVTVLSKFRFVGLGVADHPAVVVEDEMLRFIQTLIARFGFLCWCPNLRDTPYSLYNSACHIIAINTFKQALLADTYRHLVPNLCYACLYDHFIHHLQLKRFLKEQKSPGSVSQSEGWGKSYKNQLRLARAREKFAKAQRLPQHYIKILGNVKATSDDE
ncbi:hypothetical protein NEOLEDRAFT_1040197, partial [Neolentinus lepideus HHB14362 ss-1]